MHRIVVGHLARCLLLALWPGLAFAISETYEGQLIPNNNDAPIPIVVQMEELGGSLTGRIRTSIPLKGEGSIDSGRNVAGYCNLAAPISASVTLRLYGDCSSTLFEGRYTVHYIQTKKVGGGTFRLTKNVAASGKSGSEFKSADASASSVVACVKANTRCLAACPRGDTDVEYLCANRCRNKMNACKGKANKLESSPESP